MFDRKLQVDGCPLTWFIRPAAWRSTRGCTGRAANAARSRFRLKNMEHVKRTMENTVAQESLKLESGLILLAIAVSGAPFIGLLGTVWGVMSTFGGIAQQGSATMAAMAPACRPR